MIALLDANLFVPTWIIDPLLSLAEAGLCEPAWSARVMDEARFGHHGSAACARRPGPRFS